MKARFGETGHRSESFCSGSVSWSRRFSVPSSSLLHTSLASTHGSRLVPSYLFIWLAAGLTAMTQPISRTMKWMLAFLAIPGFGITLLILLGVLAFRFGGFAP